MIKMESMKLRTFKDIPNPTVDGTGVYCGGHNTLKVNCCALTHEK